MITTDDFREAVKHIGERVSVEHSRFFDEPVEAELRACILRRNKNGLYCQAEVSDRSGAVYIVNLKNITASGD